MAAKPEHDRVDKRREQERRQEKGNLGQNEARTEKRSEDELSHMGELSQGNQQR